MELDFDKYCVLDGSPTTVLPASRRHSKIVDRKSSREPKSGEEILSLKKDFSKVSLNRFRSASGREARPISLVQESKEGLKRGSVRGSSGGRKKIEFSGANASAFSSGIIDSLCNSDEDTSIGERNRSSLMSVSEQSTSSCENRMELHFWDPTENISSSDTCKKLPKARRSVQGLMTISESSIAPQEDGKVSRERCVSSSEVDGSKVTPLKKMFGPFVRSKSHKCPSKRGEGFGLDAPSGQISSSSHNVEVHGSIPLHIQKRLLDDPSDKTLVAADNNCRHVQKVTTLTSPVHIHGILKLESRQDGLIFEFSVESPRKYYIARSRKVDNGLSTVYTFRGLHHRRKGKAIGQLHVSYYLCRELKGKGGSDNSIVTEFVLYGSGHSRKVFSSQDNSGKSTASQPLGAAEMHPDQEIAAIVMQVPFKKFNSLKDPFQLEQIIEDSSDALYPGKIHVVIPDGNHSLPSDERSGPSPLLDRWRLGGGCDCGGWDMACPLNVFTTANYTGHQHMDHQHPLKLFIEGRKAKTPAFSMRAVEDGKYEVEFHAQLSSLQAFSICVSILHASESSSLISSRKNLQSDSMRVFAEEEMIINLMDAMAEEEKCKPSKVAGLTSFVLSPPFSPIARV